MEVTAKPGNLTIVLQREGAAPHNAITGYQRVSITKAPRSAKGNCYLGYAQGMT